MDANMMNYMNVGLYNYEDIGTAICIGGRLMVVLG
jgi:hypothetical protein